jgi:hypothetical protein
MHIDNYNSSATAATTFHIPSKLCKLTDSHSWDPSSADVDMDGYMAAANAAPNLIQLLSAGIRTLAPDHMQWDHTFY